MVVYTIVQGLLVRVVSVLGIVGFILALAVGAFRLSQPIILCLAIAAAYRFGINVAINDLPRYMVGVYLCYLPFVANALWAAAQLRFWRRSSV